MLIARVISQINVAGVVGRDITRSHALPQSNPWEDVVFWRILLMKFFVAPDQFLATSPFCVLVWLVEFADFFVVFLVQLLKDQAVGFYVLDLSATVFSSFEVPRFFIGFLMYIPLPTLFLFVILMRFVLKTSPMFIDLGGCVCTSFFNPFKCVIVYT